MKYTKDGVTKYSFLLYVRFLFIAYKRLSIEGGIKTGKLARQSI